MEGVVRDHLVNCGRVISATELADIVETVKLCSGLSRSELALTIAEHLDWRSASGSLKLDACVKFLEKLESQGLTKLPEKQASSAKGLKQPIFTERTAAGNVLVGKVGELGRVLVQPALESEAIGLWNEYVSRYHYLGYQQPFGCSLRYFITSESGLLGCLLFCGAAKALRERERWVGWTTEQRRRNIGYVVNNSRFLVFPWVQVKNLASHALGPIRRLGADWQQRWGYQPVMVETFVDPERYAGTCYLAANWLYLGNTTGQGLARKGKNYTSSPKKIFAKPLADDFRKRLCSEAGGTP